METPKSANQLYKESGSTLGFTQWMAENKGRIFMKNDTLSQLVEEAKQSTNVVSKPSLQSDKIFGLNKNVILISSAIILLAIGYKLYTKK